MAVCDESGFFEVFVSVCVSRYPTTLGRMMEVAGYGIWLGEGHKSNVPGVLPPNRPQNQKAALIHASVQTIAVMKSLGHSKIRINLESDYLNKNVIQWISKFKDNLVSQASNWDEHKYLIEILQLCAAVNGTIIKWCHCPEDSMRKLGLDKAKLLAQKATYDWMKNQGFEKKPHGYFTFNSN